MKMFILAVKILVTLQIISNAVQSLHFTKTVYDFTVTHGMTKNRMEFGYVEAIGANSDGEIRYSADDQLSSFVRITIYQTAGRLRLVNSVPPISFEVVVHAETGSGLVKEQADAIVRVHVKCHYLSKLWDAARV